MPSDRDFDEAMSYSFEPTEAKPKEDKEKEKAAEKEKKERPGDKGPTTRTRFRQKAAMLYKLTIEHTSPEGLPLKGVLVRLDDLLEGKTMEGETDEQGVARFSLAVTEGRTVRLTVGTKAKDVVLQGPEEEAGRQPQVPGLVAIVEDAYRMGRTPRKKETQKEGEWVWQ